MRHTPEPDTPETNAVRLPDHYTNNWENHYLNMREHARKLERRINAALQDLDSAMATFGSEASRTLFASGLAKLRQTNEQLPTDTQHNDTTND